MPVGKFVYIKSPVSGMVVGVTEESNVDGGPVTMCQKVEGCESQMWYECQISGTFRNRKSDLCMEIDVAEGEVGEGSVVVRRNKDADKSQEWILAKDRIQNKHDHTLVLQNVSESEEEGSQVGDVCYILYSMYYTTYCADLFLYCALESALQR